MKILFISDVTLNSPVSGAEQVLYQQAIGLSRNGINGYSISRENSDSGTVNYRTIQGVKEACYSANPRKAFKFMVSLFKEPPKLFDQLAAKRPFLASICHQPFTCFSLILKGKLKKIPSIYVLHSPSHEEYLLAHDSGNVCVNWINAKIRRRIEGFCLKRAQIVMVLSSYMKRKIMRIHRIPDARIVVNPGGVDLGHFQPLENRKHFKEELLFPNGKIHLLTIRNLEPRMGLDNLLKAVYHLNKCGTNVHLCVGGDGPEKKKLENIIENLGLSKQVTMTGFIPRELLVKYYGAADFFIVPSRHLEGFGLVTTESLACGTPVLGTPVGGTMEILSGIESRLLFKNALPKSMAEGIQMAIKTYLGDNNKYEQLRRQCREYAEKNYSWNRHNIHLQAVIEGLVKNIN